MNEPSAVNLILALRELDATQFTGSLLLALREDSALATLAANVPVNLDQVALRATTLHVEEYGRILGAMLFADETLHRGWAQARAYAAGLGLPLRLRLQLPDSLQALAWETLRDPLDRVSVALHGQVWLTRDLDSSSLYAAPVPTSASLQAVVAVADPLNLEAFQLAPVNALRETTNARVTLGQTPLTILARAVNGQVVSAQNIAAALRQGAQLLYLVAHGSWMDGNAYIWLESETGLAAPTPVTEIASIIGGLGAPPRLAIMMSCHSAGIDGISAMKALGPHLVRAGVPTVIAMQGRIGFEVSARFTLVLLDELRRDGVVDRALSIARLAIGSTSDWWMPVLYSRLPDNRLWRQGDDHHLPPQIASSANIQRPMQSDQLLSLRKVLMACDELQSQRELRALFGNSVLKIWQARLPEADSLATRVDLTLDYLRDRKTIDGRTGIYLLLESLLQRYDPSDERYALLQASLHSL